MMERMLILGLGIIVIYIYIFIYILITVNFIRKKMTEKLGGVESIFQSRF